MKKSNSLSMHELGRERGRELHVDPGSRIEYENTEHQGFHSALIPPSKVTSCDPTCIVHRMNVSKVGRGLPAKELTLANTDLRELEDNYSNIVTSSMCIS